MTTTDTAATTAQEGTETTETDPKGAAAPEGQADPPEGGKEGNKEAAAYRRKLRDAEADRDRLAGQLTTYQRRDAEALVGDKLLSASDLWVAGIELKDLLGDDGNVDKAKVDEAVDKLLTDRPHWAPKRPGVPRDMGQGRRGGSVGGDVTWGTVIKGR